jgi:hypothetical protein
MRPPARAFRVDYRLPIISIPPVHTISRRQAQGNSTEGVVIGLAYTHRAEPLARFQCLPVPFEYLCRPKSGGSHVSTQPL